jgi:hypothetical protein
MVFHRDHKIKPGAKRASSAKPFEEIIALKQIFRILTGSQSQKRGIRTTNSLTMML